MKIENNSPLQSARARKLLSKAKGSAFAESLSAGSAASLQETTETQAGTFDACLILQASPEQGEAIKLATQRATFLLERLDTLRLALLTGTLSINTLKELKALMKNRRDAFQDPALKEIIDELDVRVAVELAKLSPLT